MKRLTRLTAAATGSALALVPAVAGAQEPVRALESAENLWTAGLFAALGAGALLLLSSIAYLYRRERGLLWEFQKPDAPADDDVHD